MKQWRGQFVSVDTLSWRDTQSWDPRGATNPAPIESTVFYTVGEVIEKN